MNAVSQIGATGPVYHAELIQGTDEWLAQRLGILCASEIKHILTAKTLKYASNDKERTHLFELLAQRITDYVEPHYVSDDMLRGRDDEIEARLQYSKHFAPVTEVGFITNDKWGFTIGYSPDGLVGDDGLIECKSRRAKYQIQTIAENEVPDEFTLQLQTGLLVSEREWIDFVSYSGGLPMFVKRVYPNAEIQDAIVAAAASFESRIEERARQYHDTLAAMPVVIPTERRIEQEMFS
ncbi:YqaJ-like recombinase domain-containing protein [Sphingobium faniae]|nr:YqaJ-like recombinase domain-containing protein [Sphingobium faniae]